MTGKFLDQNDPFLYNVSGKTYLYIITVIPPRMVIIYFNSIMTNLLIVRYGGMSFAPLFFFKLVS